MAEITTTQAFSDGDTVTATKLNNITGNASIQTEAITNRSAETTVDQANDLLLMYDASATALKKVTLSNVIKAGTASNFPVTGNATIGGTLGVTGVVSAASTIELGHASDTTLARGAAGRITVEGVNVPTISSTDTLTNKTLTSPSLASPSITSGVLTTQAGSASTPAIVPTGDTNTGIFFPAADTIAFAEGGTEAMRIDSSGNVGIGLASPEQKLHLQGSSGVATVVLVTGDGAFASFAAERFQDLFNGPSVALRKGRGSKASPLAVQAGDNIGIINFSAYGGSNLRQISQIRGEVEAYTSDTNISSNLIFSTTSSSFAPSERLRIDSSGQVGIGTASPSAQLELSTDSAKKPSTNTWTIASDSRLKTNITDANKDRCLEIVRQIPLKRYTWKNEVYSQEAVKDRSKLGWIAQDVESVFPKAVGTNRFAYNQVFEDVVTPELDEDGNAVLDEDGNAKTKTEKRLVSEDVIEDCKDLNSDQIYAVMYGAIQKLAEENDSLKARIAALEAA